MTGLTDTIDWNSYWREADEAARDGASPSTNHVVDVLPEFVTARDLLDGSDTAIADVGCGPGHVAFALARQFPETTVVGYDAAAPVVADNRERARDAGLDNLRFEQAMLPEFDPGRAFDLVFSYFTLCYVPAVERAVRALYDAVAPGGDLVVNYQNELARAHWQRMADNPDEFLGPNSAFDPDRFAERFAPLLAGESTLSYERIHAVLGTWPRSVWSVVEKPDIRWAWRHHPLVFVPK